MPVLYLSHGAPMLFEGTGSEDDEIVTRWVDEVKARIASLIQVGLAHKKGLLLSRNT